MHGAASYDGGERGRPVTGAAIRPSPVTRSAPCTPIAVWRALVHVAMPDLGAMLAAP